MNALQAYKYFADSNDWLLLWPEVSLGIVALLLLTFEWIFPKEKNRVLVPVVTVATQLLLLAACISFLCCTSTIASSGDFSGLIKQTTTTAIFRVFFLISSLFVTYLGIIYFRQHPKSPQVEFYHIILLLTAGFMLLVQSQHFLLFFVALELVTVSFYVMVSYARERSNSLEAGLKYLVLGALSSPMLLLGIVLLYGVAGNPSLVGHAADAFNFAELEHFIIANPDNLLIHVGAVLVLCGIAFKIGAVPFQIWVPDVYQGAPTPVTAFLAVASKAAGFAVLLNLVQGPFEPLAPVLIPLLSAVAAVTILFGNIAALTQRNTKRLMGLSGIAHAGYLLVGVVASFRVEWAAGAVIFYLFTYLLGSFAVFGVMALQRPEEDMWQTLDDYENLRKKQPYLAAILTIGLGSLAGIPPLVGFIGKFLLFVAAYQAGLYSLLGVAIVGVVISIYYYFGWIRSAYFRSWDLTPEEEAAAVELRVGIAHRLVLGLVAFATVALGFYQAGLSVHLF